MLKHRVFTAICLATILLWAVFGWPFSWFAGLLTLVSLVAAWEWSRMCGLRSSVHRGAYMLVAGGASTIPMFYGMDEIPALYIAGSGFVFWIIVAAFLLRDRVPAALNGRVDGWRMIVAVPVFSVVVWGLVWLRDSEPGSPLLLLYVFCIVWLADIGAYFAGRRWGKHKLAPTISPGKTREGAIGGAVAVALWAALFVIIEPFPFSGMLLFVATMSAAIISVFGDLFESSMKRSAGIKDSGAILPGHGGILDRIDSLLAAVPVFVFIVVLGS
jgi:phosphatidate cytidylyltransferase